MNSEFEDEFEDILPVFEELPFDPATKRESSADIELTPELVKQFVEMAFKAEREQVKRDLKREQARPGNLHRKLQKIAKDARWDMIRSAIDEKLARGETDRKLPDLEAVFVADAHIVADRWKLHEGDPRRQTLIDEIIGKNEKKGIESSVSDSTVKTAEQYLTKRLKGLAPEAAKLAVEGMSKFRP